MLVGPISWLAQAVQNDGVDAVPVVPWVLLVLLRNSTQVIGLSGSWPWDGGTLPELIS